VKVKTAEFEAALKKILTYTSRDFPTVINDTARDIIIKAAADTHKADPSKIERQLTTGVIIRTHSKKGRLLKNPKTVAYKPAKLVYLIIAAKRTAQGKPGLSQGEMSREAQKFIKRRKSGVGFTAFAGWQKALMAVGGRGFGSKAMQSGFEQSSAREGYGEKATPEHMIAKIVNTASAIEIYGAIPLQTAINNKTQSMLKHLDEKLAKRFSESR
jgi:hypothetical protein